MRIHCLQHVSFEGPGVIADWARSRGHALAVVRPDQGSAMPDRGGFDWLVVMGGPMSVHDVHTYPWLEAENRLIRDAIERSRTVVGVCLGAQLVAHALGARVFPAGHREIGWFDVDLTPEAGRSGVFGDLPRRLKAFHWHGETFDLPGGAVRLAGNDACAHQAFSYGERTLAMQFHLEVTERGVRRLVEHGAHDIVAGPFVQPVDALLSASPEDIRRMHGWMFGILDRLVRV